jgi:glycine cleavage system H protein
MSESSYRYASSHEWIHLDGNVGTVGISAFAVSQLSDLVNLELPKEGTSYDAGDAFGEVESVKTVSDLYAPVAGKVVSVNNEVVNNLELLADSPLEDGWLIKLEVNDPDDVDNLMSEEDYEESIAAEDDLGDDLDLDDLLDADADDDDADADADDGDDE